MNKALLFICLFWMCLLSSLVHAGRIERAFEALEEYDYFKAKKIFTKAIRRKTSPAGFGLATIYFRNDNPFHSLDSAYKYIHISKDHFPKLSDSKKLRYSEIGFNQNAIDSLQSLISSAFYSIAKDTNTVERYTTFIEKHSEAKECEAAVYSRDSLAFLKAQKENSSLAYADFLSTYPNSILKYDATDALMDAQYSESTRDGKLESYQMFLLAYPENRNVGKAEDEIYRLATKPNTIVSLEEFLENHPNNRNREKAWQRLYQSNVYEYTPEAIKEFITKYPQYPYIKDVKAELNMIEHPLFPVRKNGKFGFMDTTEHLVIPTIYDGVSPFHEGLAHIEKNGKVGVINKKGKIVVTPQYDAVMDFEIGRAIVELNKKFGIIDRSGVVVLPTEFEDIGNVSEGMIYGLKDSLYGYYNASGEEVLPAQFDDAYSFSNGLAKVEENGLQAFIDKEGNYVVHPAFEEIEFFTDSLLIYGNENRYGLMQRSCQIVVPNQYDAIGELSDNGLAIIVKDEKIGYMDAYGKVEIEPQYDLIPNYLKQCKFRNGAATVLQDGKAGIIATTGKTILPFKYENLGEWMEYIAYQKEGRWGYINRANRKIIENTYDFAESFDSGLGIVQKRSLFGAIDVEGNKIIETAYNNIEKVNSNLYIVNNGALFGVLDAKGEEVAPMIFNNCSVFNSKYLIFTASNEIKYLHIPSRKMIILQE